MFSTQQASHETFTKEKGQYGETITGEKEVSNNYYDLQNNRIVHKYLIVVNNFLPFVSFWGFRNFCPSVREIIRFTLYENVPNASNSKNSLALISVQNYQLVRL